MAAVLGGHVGVLRTLPCVAPVGGRERVCGQIPQGGREGGEEAKAGHPLPSQQARAGVEPGGRRKALLALLCLGGLRLPPACSWEWGAALAFSAAGSLSPRSSLAGALEPEIDAAAA